MSKTNLPINYIKVPTPTKKDYPGGSVGLPTKYTGQFMGIKEILNKSKGKKNEA